MQFDDQTQHAEEILVNSCSCNHSINYPEPDPCYDVPSYPNPDPCYDVPSYLNPDPCYDVPSYPNPDPCYNVPSYLTPDSCYDISKDPNYVLYCEYRYRPVCVPKDPCHYEVGNYPVEYPCEDIAVPYQPHDCNYNNTNAYPSPRQLVEVEFVAQGGTPARTILRVQSGQRIGTLPNVTRLGYHFLGWFTSPTGGTQITVNTVVWGNESFFARWQSVIVNGRVTDSRVIQQPRSIGHNLPSNMNLTSINAIVVHHSVSPTNPSIDDINSWWTGRIPPWSVPGYHFIIRGDGQIWQLAPINARVGGTRYDSINFRTIQIAFAGTFAQGVQCTPLGIPVPAARAAFSWLCRILMSAGSLPNLNNTTQIFGHNSIQGGSTCCPGFTDAQIRSWV